MQSQTISSSQEKLLERLDKMEKKVQRLEEIINNLEKKIEEPEGRKAKAEFMELPESIRKTMTAISRIRKASAKQVAEETGRTRGMESIYLNQLERLGYVEKTKKGRDVSFRSLRIV